MVLAAFAAGGLLKGAIGAGVPVVVIPTMTLIYDVRFAVAVFVIPALLSNLWQVWQFRASMMPRDFLIRLAGGAAVGALVGSIMLASLPAQVLTAFLALLTLSYVAFRFARPGWQLPYPQAHRLALPMGGLAGILQGSAGISAPVSLTFVNSMGLDRAPFIATISVLFTSMALVQFPSLLALGLLTPERMGISLLACLPLFGAMPVGAWLARFMSRETFDRVILGLLVVIAARLLWAVFAG
jgi:uncharacterized membrane protein YfcA